MPPVGRILYGKIVEELKLAGQPVPDETDQSAADQPAPGLPVTWDEIAVGHLVIARDSTVDDGWWEAIVVARDGDMLTLNQRRSALSCVIAARVVVCDPSIPPPPFPDRGKP